MTLPVFPTVSVANIKRRLAKASVTQQSPFSLTRQSVDWGGRAWVYQLEFAPLKAEDGRRLDAFLNQNAGISGFLFTDPSIKNKTTTSAVLVNGASQTGRTLATDGWGEGNGTTVLVAGDFISIGADDATWLYQVTADVTVTGGAADISIEPGLRASPPDNAAVEIAAPNVQLFVAENPLADLRPADFYYLTLEAFENV